MNEYIQPEQGKNYFNCPWCNVATHQNWIALVPISRDFFSDWINDSNYRPAEIINTSQCISCLRFSLWAGEKLLIPTISNIPQPLPDMPDNIVKIYHEAMEIYDKSPRAASALLRLAVQMLTIHLGGNGKNLNDDIKMLVSRGLPVQVQQAMDIVRIIGNNAVHPGEINFDDNQNTSITLFSLLNEIVRIMITHPKDIENLYNKLPSNALMQIQKRDET